MAKLLWTQRQDVGPSPRTHSAAAYDTSAKRVLLYGGEHAPSTAYAMYGDTWEWDGSFWTQLADIGPSPRLSHALAYDPNRDRTVLFGGASGQMLLADTWEWDGQEWTQVQDTGPSARCAHALVYDSRRQRTLLFGGADANTSFGDTWAWDGTEWTKLEDTGPPARAAHGMAYDRERDRVVVFGGNVRTTVTVTQTVPNTGVSGAFGGTHTETTVQKTSQALNDTWEYTGSLWTQIADTGPDARAACSLVFAGTECVLFGGNNGATRFGDTWFWNGKFWTQRQDIGPSPRSGMAMTWDSDRNRIVLFGGSTGSAAGDTWELPSNKADLLKNPRPSREGVGGGGD